MGRVVAFEFQNVVTGYGRYGTAHYGVECNIGYEFTVKGALHRGTGLVPPDHIIYVDGAHRRLRDLNPGDVVPVWYDPAKVTRSGVCIDRVRADFSPPALATILLVIGIFLIAMSFAPVGG